MTARTCGNSCTAITMSSESEFHHLDHDGDIHESGQRGEERKGDPFAPARLRLRRDRFLQLPSSRSRNRLILDDRPHLSATSASNPTNSRNMYRIVYPNSDIAAFRRSDSSPSRS